MYESPNGEYVRGFLASSDLSTAADIPLFDRNRKSRVLVAGERLVLDYISISNGGTASVVTVYQDDLNDGTVDAGEELFASSLVANTQNFFDGGEIHLAKVTAAGGKLRAKASAASANTRIVVVGQIVNT